MFGYVYILLSIKNNRYYIGSTDNINRRIEEHNNGKSVYTRPLRPLILVYSEKFTSLKIARQMEHLIKRMKSRKIIDRILSEGNTNFLRV